MIKLNIYTSLVNVPSPSPVSPVKVMVLILDNTGVAGDVNGLAPLVDLTHQLAYLSLSNTKVSGCAALCADSGPFHASYDQHSGPDDCTC
jgi:hypothetical protein